MEENQKTNKTKLSTFIIVLAVLVIIIMAGFIYMQKINSDREISGLKNDAEELKATVTELQGKIDTSAEIPDTVESNQETSSTTVNQFSTYQENFEKTYKSVLGSTVEGEYVADQFDGPNYDRNIKVDKKGNAYYDDRKIDTNVAYIRYCSTGQDGGDAVLIHRDGTVSVVKEFGFPDKKVEVSKIENVKNIVNVISVVESGVDDIDGGWTYYLVDINGNIIDIND